jgi:acyl-CoA thioesterase I
VPRLQTALAAKGIAAAIVNAGVSGDTAAGALARLDWSVPDGTDAVIVELGANDMLRGFKPEVTRDALDKILQRLKDRHIAVLLCGMRAAPNLGADFGRSFEPIYPELAAKYGALLYPFFLDGVAGDRSLNQHDGLHPTAAGVDVIVAAILPKVEELIGRGRASHPS